MVGRDSGHLELLFGNTIAVEISDAVNNTIMIGQLVKCEVTSSGPITIMAPGLLNFLN